MKTRPAHYNGEKENSSREEAEWGLTIMGLAARKRLRKKKERGRER